MPFQPPIVKLTRMRERNGDNSSRTLCFTFPKLTGRGSRAACDFVDPQHVPAFEGEEAWFVLEKVKAIPWPYWRAVRQVEAPQRRPEPRVQHR